MQLWTDEIPRGQRSPRPMLLGGATGLAIAVAIYFFLGLLPCCA